MDLEVVGGQKSDGGGCRETQPDDGVRGEFGLATRRRSFAKIHKTNSPVSPIAPASGNVRSGRGKRLTITTATSGTLSV